MQEPSTISVLIIEDDERLASLTKEYLDSHGAIVEVARDGKQGLEVGVRGGFDVILLDIMLPEMDGLEVCRRLRERSDVPIIMITARGEEADRVMGLETGADDYVAKPYSVRELLARIRSVVRRYSGRVGPNSAPVRVGALAVDPTTHSARLDGVTVDLTGYEFSLLFALCERAGQVLSRERLMELAGGNVEESFDRSIDVHISRLRQKLEDNPKRPELIKTVRGVGYVLSGEAAK